MGGEGVQIMSGRYLVQPPVMSGKEFVGSAAERLMKTLEVPLPPVCCEKFITDYCHFAFKKNIGK